MKALVYGVKPEPWEPPDPSNPLQVGLANSPIRLVDDREEPHPKHRQWVMAKTRMTGICGSDAKQVFMDFGKLDDTPLNGFFSMPTVLGHEVVAEVAELGPGVRGLEVGQRVVLNPGSRAGRGASTRRARPVGTATTASAGTSRRASSPRGSTPAPRRTPPGAAPTTCPPTTRCSSRCPTTCPTSWPCWPIRLRCPCTRSPGTHRPRRAGVRVRRRRARHDGHRHPAGPLSERRGHGGGAFPAQAELARRLGATVVAPRARSRS